MVRRISLFGLLLFMASNLAMGQYEPAMPEHSGIPESTIWDGLETAGYNTLMAAVKAADLSELLSKEGPFTIFAPSDKAFAHLPKEKLATLLRPENFKELQALVAYHIIAGELTASKILRAMCRGAGTATFTTVQGNEILASMDGIDILLTDCSGNSARITTADNPQRNGVIHVIDSVILPR